MVRSQPLQIASQHPETQEHVWIAGETAVSRALVRLAESVNFRISVVPRPQDVLTKTVFGAFPAAPTIALIFLESLEDQVTVLSHWMHFPLVFVGVAASRERRTEIISRLQTLATGREHIERIHCPIGLPIGASNAEEAAIGIAGQIIQNRSDRRISHEAAARIKSPSLIKARA